jgi:methanogenic corrinoid protein MtbC1
MDRNAYQLSLNVDSTARALAQWTVSRLDDADPTLGERYGDDWRTHWLRDIQVRIHHLAQAVAIESPDLFVASVRWSQAAYLARRIDGSDLRRALECLSAVIEHEVPAPMKEALHPIISAAMRATVEDQGIAKMPATRDRLMDPDSPTGLMTLRYLEALLDGEQRAAEAMILGAAESGMSIEVIYEDVLRVAQREIGLMWHHNEITVADEHFATATTDIILSRLRQYFPPFSPRDRRLVATTVGGDLHALGVRMVADFFEIDGWNVYYLGANTPRNDIIDITRHRNADLLALSAASVLHIRDLAELIDSMREHEDLDDVRVLVGGPVFCCLPELWRQLGADGSAQTGPEAVEIGNRLFDTFRLARGD